jgi:hypothetical protein
VSSNENIIEGNMNIVGGRAHYSYRVPILRWECIVRARRLFRYREWEGKGAGKGRAAPTPANKHQLGIRVDAPEGQRPYRGDESAKNAGRRLLGSNNRRVMGRPGPC